MAVTYYFGSGNWSPDQYAEALTKLEAAGVGAPDGRTHHIAGVADNGTVWVLDVWETPEQHDAFGETLRPILGELGVDPGEPIVTPLQNYIAG